MLFPIQTPALPPTVPVIRAYALYAGDHGWPGADASYRTGTMFIVRWKETDGSSITDLRVVPFASSRRALRVLSSGRIVRDAQGYTLHVEVSTKGFTQGTYGEAAWDRSSEKGPLTGWSKSFQADRHPVTLPNGFYSLGVLEALTYDPGLSTWRVPNPADTRQVTYPQTFPRPYCEYALGPASYGRFTFQGAPRDLAVRRVFCKEDWPTNMTINGQTVDANFAVIALFDASGRLAGLGYQHCKSNDLDSMEWGGMEWGSDTFEGHPRSPNSPFPNPFGPFVFSFAAALPLTPVEEAALLRQMG